MPIVIDANITISWFTSAPPTIADRALHELSSHGGIVPALWRWEVQDVLLRLQRLGHMTMPLDRALLELRELPISVDDEFSGLFSQELSIAQQYGLTVYDASYLEVAIRYAIPLATNDKKLAAAAKKAGLGLPT